MKWCCQIDRLDISGKSFPLEFLLFAGPRRFLYYSTLRLFASEEVSINVISYRRENSEGWGGLERGVVEKGLSKEYDKC